MGRILIILGAAILVAGLLTVFLGKIGFVGRLPGDIIFQRGNFTFYFPLVTFLIVSVILSIVLNLVLKLFR